MTSAYALPYGMVGKRASDGNLSSVVLAEYAFDINGPFPTLGRQLLEADGSQNSVDGYSICSLDREGLSFFVASRTEPEQRRGNEALQLIASSFAARIGMSRARGATRRYAFNTEFAPIIQRHLETFSKMEEMDDELNDLQNDLESAKGKAQGTLRYMVDRGLKLDSIGQVSEELNHSSYRFKTAVTSLRYMECWIKYKSKIIMGTGFAVAMVLLVLWFTS